MPRIGIITGVKPEEEALSTVLTGPDAPYLRLSGARPARARRGVEAMLALGVDGILSFGSAGGLSSRHQPGSLLVGETVQGSGGERYSADPSWTTRMLTATGAEAVTVIGLDHIAGAEDKARLGQAGADIIDMESHIVARLATDAGVPFAVLRAVVDPVGFDIPAYALDAVRPDGSISLLPVIAGLCIQPWTIGRMLDLNSFNRKAMDSLSGATRVLGPGFGLFAL